MQASNTTAILAGSLLADVKLLADGDLFAKAFRDEIGGDATDDHVMELRAQILALFREAAENYRQAIVQDLMADKADVDERHSIIVSDTVKSLYTLIHADNVNIEIMSRVVRSFNAIMFQLKNIFEDVINRWLKFYTKEFWIMIELGVIEYSTMDKYVYWKLMTSLEKANPEVKYLREMFSEFIQGISAKVVSWLTLDWNSNTTLGF